MQIQPLRSHEVPRTAISVHHIDLITEAIARARKSDLGPAAKLIKSDWALAGAVSGFVRLRDLWRGWHCRLCFSAQPYSHRFVARRRED